MSKKSLKKAAAAPITPKKPHKALKRADIPMLVSFEAPSAPPKRSMVADMQVLEASADPEKVLELTSVTQEELDAVRKAAPKFLSTEEKLAILEMHSKQYATEVIAGRLARNPDTIRKFLSDYKPTTTLARAYFEAKAEILAARVVKHADVDQSLEIMDRLDVLNAKRKDAANTQTQFNVIVGVSGNAQMPSAVPVPTQEAIEAALKASE